MILRSSSSLNRDHNRSPVLVFLHYFSGAAVSWQWVIDELKADFRCVAFDLPGFGKARSLAFSSLPGYGAFVREKLAALNLDKNGFVLVGHSMGGKIALQVAAADALEGLRQVVLVAPSPPTQEQMPSEEKERLLNNHPSRANAETTVKNATQVDLPESRHETAIQTHMQAEDLAWKWWLLGGMNHSIAHQMEAIQVPVTVVASHDDPVISYDLIQKEVVELLPTAKLVELSDVGHLMPLEAPERLAQEIRDAVSQNSARKEVLIS